jgi:hypothetical protein
MLEPTLLSVFWGGFQRSRALGKHNDDAGAASAHSLPAPCSEAQAGGWPQQPARARSTTGSSRIASRSRAARSAPAPAPAPAPGTGTRHPHPHRHRHPAPAPGTGTRHPHPHPHPHPRGSLQEPRSRRRASSVPSDLDLRSQIQTNSQRRVGSSIRIVSCAQVRRTSSRRMSFRRRSQAIARSPLRRARGPHPDRNRAEPAARAIRRLTHLGPAVRPRLAGGSGDRGCRELRGNRSWQPGNCPDQSHWLNFVFYTTIIKYMPFLVA